MSNQAQWLGSTDRTTIQVARSFETREVVNWVLYLMLLDLITNSVQLYCTLRFADSGHDIEPLFYGTDLLDCRITI